MQNMHVISKKDLFDLLGRLATGSKVMVPYLKNDKLHFDEFDPTKEDKIELGGIRQSSPFKSFISPVREKVVGLDLRDNRPLVVAGVKGCDLSSLILQDFVFKGGDVEDPFYARKRSNTTIIAVDCTYAKETCFCVAMDGAPYPKKFFDLSLAYVDNYFLVEVGSPAGGKIVDDFRTFFKNAPIHAVGVRESNRDKVSKQIESFINDRGTPYASRVRGLVKKNYELVEFWQDMASTCVECGACNLACPTCHCFLLFDEKGSPEAKRFKIWDACLYSTFARVAGNHNPRKHLYERLRNRFDKKFEFFPQVLNYVACTGCGRCIEACPGNIDIREVLKGLVLERWNKPPHD